MSPAPGLLARGPWRPDQVAAHWRDEEYEPGPEAAAAADAAIAELRERGSPSHDGLSARLADYDATTGRLELELQPMRWSLRLGEDASHALASLCVTRAADGRWLAGRRAPWVATWAGRWALGAGGAVEVGENPTDTLARELAEEWSVAPQRMSVEALVRIPSGLVLLVGVAWLPEDTEVTPDDEHDAFAWWPAEVEQWPDEADAPLRAMASLLAAS
ncbi:MAG: 8-oxo-dGTP diphosphatase [Solirubrobacteraceae bacterium]|jgi:ADP-ribose pyrophosphatase YjhB (NUDIX family)|nr:8-oxo-dGTP diphosphatase [Solirubrobacteraceae bacterium]MDX6675057.1 8-oxo-dGTP diphosphatase [Solirubrobacteraceae bacterium]